MAPIKYDIEQWLKDNEKFFVPPICNKLMYGDGQLKTFFVGGPNSRKDFHMEEGEEFFYMLKGDMKLIVFENGKFRDINIREGEVFLLPPRIPHSPQRFANTLGLVIERERLPTELDCLRYYVENSNEILYEKWFYCKSLEELGPLIKEYFASEAHLIGKPIPGSIKEEKPIKQDFTRILDDPFSLNQWLNNNEAAVDIEVKKPLFKGNYVSRIHVLGKGTHVPDDKNLPETFLWQISGKSCISVDGQQFELLKDQTLLIPRGESYILENETGGRILSVVMDLKPQGH